MNEDTFQMSYVISSEFSIETIGEVIKELDALPTTKLKLYVSSVGGDTVVIDILIDFLRNRFEDVLFVCTGAVISSAWKLVAGQDFGRVKVIEDSFAIDHLTTLKTAVIIKSGHTDLNYIEFSEKNMEESEKRWRKFCKKTLGYTKEELKLLKTNKNVLLDYKRMREIIKFKERNYGWR